MPSASLAIQTAIYTTLSSAAPLTALLGGAKVYDDVPRNTPPPYVAIAQSSVRDWSTGSDTGDEHTISLHIWSGYAGKREVLEIASAIRAALHDQPLTLDGHRLINLRHEFSETRRERDGGVHRGLVRLRATTEPMA